MLLRRAWTECGSPSRPAVTGCRSCIALPTWPPSPTAAGRSTPILHTNFRNSPPAGTSPAGIRGEPPRDRLQPNATIQGIGRVRIRLTGVKRGEKVDYAIFKDGKVQILIECKKMGETLDLGYAS